jgi:mutator protein MutT
MSLAKPRFTLSAAAHLLLIQDNQVLLARRFQTGYKDGWYAFPAGHLEGDETATAAMIREAREEIAVIIQPAHLTSAHIMHRRTDREYIDFFFVCQTWQGTPKVAEPDKCDDVAWFALDALPTNAIDFVAKVVKEYQAGRHYSELGWEGS